MNHSLLSADRNTHLKIVSLALTAAITLVVIGITARNTDGMSAARVETRGPALQAGKAMMYSRTELPSVH